MQKDSYKTPARTYAKGIGDAVADRTINRKINRMFEYVLLEDIEIPRRDDISLDHEVAEWCKSNGKIISSYHVHEGDDLTLKITLNVIGRVETETWADVAERVAYGSSLLTPVGKGNSVDFEFHEMHHHLRQASLLMSGRHLQHGDGTQPTRNMEVFTNCLERSTRILTLEHGPVEIGKVAGETVTVKARDGEWRPAKVKSYGKQDLFKITFAGRNGQVGNVPCEVVATANHRWFLADGSVTDAIKVGDWLEPASDHTGSDSVGVTHGLIFGDGSAHKQRHDHSRPGVSQGRTYASIRVCKSDSVKDEIHAALDGAGFSFSTPPHAKDDRVYYLGKQEHFKELPFTNDPSYIAGFIHGWWLADGSKYYKQMRGGLEISTTSEEAVEWLKSYAAYAGYVVTGLSKHDRKAGDGSYANGKALYSVRLAKERQLRVLSVESAGHDEVFCVEEPVTTGFVLANGLLTGNCSTSAMTSLSFYLLLNGSGVGRAYDDDMMLVNYADMPIVVPVIDMMHKDCQSGEIVALDMRNAEHLYAGSTIHYFEVPDSREGWAKALEKMEVMAFEMSHRDSVLILDFSKVRPRGSPIGGMQNRPASGPGPLISAIKMIAQLRDAGMAPWRSTMFADHYAAECVLVGGARRAARMATKTWRDKSVIDFIQVKRGGFLWSSNNSVTVDDEFWGHVKAVGFEDCDTEEAHNLRRHAKQVFDLICEASYHDGTGEPGIISQDKLTQNDEGFDGYLDGKYVESERYKMDEDALNLTSSLAAVVRSKRYTQITNPCGEITLIMLGAYCTIADVVPYFAKDDDDAEDAFRTATRALIRTNLMDCLYSREVQRTNRIGVGMTGFHEWVWNRFDFGWAEIVDEEKSKEMWLTLSRFKRAIVDESVTYSKALGVVAPHTDTTMKPAGTTSKLFGLTEGAHLPSMREYLRWVQFRNDDPLIDVYKAKGYPVRHLKTYSGTTIVGFPTEPLICSLGMGDRLVTAAEATPEEQYQYLRLMEKYWIVGVEKDGVTPLVNTGNQVSYTLKYDPKVVGFDEFKRTLLDGQSSIRCCSVMPQTDSSAYEYIPEQMVTKHEFDTIAAAITNAEEVKEDIGMEHVDCGGGACPISFNENR